MQTVQLILSAPLSCQTQAVKKAAAQQLRLPSDHISHLRIVKRSVDARQRLIKVMLTVQVFLQGEDPAPAYLPPHFLDVRHAKQTVAIVGAGPAGLFAALTLIEKGIRPILIDRGKEVSERKKDIALLNRNQGLIEDSNYCFGEGGAGTFSDGKLFSRSKKRGDMQRVMELFHFFGADPSVLYETHAHIGSDRLPSIIRRIRQTIIEWGGEVCYNTRIDHLHLTDDGRRVLALVAADGREFRADAFILAIGHSAHDTYRMLAREGIDLERKGFALGVRVEHPQSLINRLMYHTDNLPEGLGNASYSLVTQVEGRGVYSFCMCPGGHIVPAGSMTDGCVVNGMSASHRNSPFANSGIVVEIRESDLDDWTPPMPIPHEQEALRGLFFQEYVEHLAYEHAQVGGVALSKAPAQRLRDFVEGKASASLPPCSYLPGIVPSRLDLWLPPIIGQRLQQGFRDFDRKYHGYLTNDAVILGVESRSSSPVRIPRHADTMQHITCSNLYPVGEGAGYAGGITSSALDGINAALKIASLSEDNRQSKN